MPPVAERIDVEFTNCGRAEDLHGGGKEAFAARLEGSLRNVSSRAELRQR